MRRIINQKQKSFCESIGNLTLVCIGTRKAITKNDPWLQRTSQNYNAVKRRNHSHPQELPMFAEIRDLLALISSVTTLVMLLISRHAFYYIYISRWYYTPNEFFAESSSFHLQEMDQYFYRQRMCHYINGPSSQIVSLTQDGLYR